MAAVPTVFSEEVHVVTRRIKRFHKPWSVKSGKTALDIVKIKNRLVFRGFNKWLIIFRPRNCPCSYMAEYTINPDCVEHVLRGNKRIEKVVKSFGGLVFLNIVKRIGVEESDTG